MKPTTNQIKAYIDENLPQMIEDLGSLVAINSVSSARDCNYPFGKECGRALKTALSMGESMGFKAKNADNYYGELVLQNGADDIGFFAHLDIVPAGIGWSSEPFTLTEHEGYLIGRGVNDDKGPAICAIYAVKCLMDLKADLKHTIRIILGCSEETGMDDMEHFKKTAKPPKYCIIPDAEFPVCCGEKGILTTNLTFPADRGNIVSFIGGEVSNKVCETATLILADVDFDECEQDGITVSKTENGIKIDAVGISSHAAMPEGSKNAIKMLVDFALSNNLLKDGAVAIAQNISEILADYYGENLEIDMSDSLSGKLTCVSGIVSSKDEEIVLNLNIRYPVTQKGEDVVAMLTKSAEKRGFSVSDVNNSKPAYVSPDSEFIKLLGEAYSEVTGKDSTPYTIGGGTYARHLENAVAFGIMEADDKHPFEKGKGGEHQADEAVSINALKTAVLVYALAILKIDNL